MPNRSHSSRTAAVRVSAPLERQPREATTSREAQRNSPEPDWPLSTKAIQILTDPIASVEASAPAPSPQPRIINDKVPLKSGSNDLSSVFNDSIRNSFPVNTRTPPPSPPTSTTSKSSTGNLEDGITVPLVKLQQLVQLCADVLRESRESATEPDLEQGVRRSQHFHVDLDLSLASERPKPPFAWPGIGPEDRRYQPIIQIWDEVDPFQLKQVPVLGEDESDGVLNYTSYSTVDDLYTSSQGGKGGGNGSISKEDRASALAWQIMRYNAQYLEWSSILVVVCSSYANEPNCTIGDILEHCYERRVLTQPESLNPLEYLNHLQSIVKSLFILNFVFSCSGLLPIPERYPSSIVGTVFNERPESLMGMRISSLFRLLHIAYPDYRNTDLDCASGSTLRIDDLNINSLRSIGNLSIVWTEVVENHLKLDLNTMTLFVVWEPQFSDSSLMGRFQKSMTRCRDINPACARNGFTQDELERSAYMRPRPATDENEIRRTWSILFATSSRFNKRVSSYEQLDVPPWSSMGTPNFVESYRSLHLGTDKSIRGRLTRIDMDTVLQAALDKRPLQYSEFPIFQTRLRQLRHYMDQQRPRGFRQLWRDRRDTLSYYTFWGVIIFGGASVILALLGLGVGVAQTVASFESLKSSSRGGAS